MSERAITLCSTHEREYRARVRAMARQRIASSDCPLCLTAGDIEDAARAVRCALAALADVERRLSMATARADAAEAEADRMNAVVGGLRSAARDGLSTGQYWATLQTIAEGGPATTPAPRGGPVTRGELPEADLSTVESEG